MAQTKINLDRQTEGRVLALGGSGAGQQALLTLNKGTAPLSTVVLDVLGSQSIAGDLNLAGNLNITGNLNTVNVTNTNVADVTITLNDGGTSAAAVGAGLNIEGDGGAVIAAIRHIATGSRFTIGDGTTQREIVDVSSSQTLTNKIIGGSQISGNIAGSAANVTGIVAVANGGTGVGTLAAGYVKSNGTSAFTSVSAIPKADVGLGNVENTALSTWAGSSNITTVGTIGSGTWNGTTISVGKGGTGKTSIASGALLVGNGGGVPTELVGTTSGHVVTWNGSTFVVQAPSGSSAIFRAAVVSGTQDGSNRTFTIGAALSSGSEQVFLNGQLLNPGGTNDYTITGTTITLAAGFPAPLATDVIRIYGVY